MLYCYRSRGGGGEGENKIIAQVKQIPLLSGCRIWVCRWMTSGMVFRGRVSLQHPKCLCCSFLNTLSVRFIKRMVLIVYLKCNKSGVIASSMRKMTCIIFKIFLYD